MPFLVLLLLFPGFFINLLWGAEYLLAENSLRLLAVGMFAISFAGVSNSLLSSKGKSKILLFNLIVISIINLVLNFILVPMYGINGAAISTMISLILWSAITLLQAFVFTSILPLRRKMVSVVVSLFIATGVLVYLRSMVEINMSTMLLLGSLFLLVYVLLIFLTRSFDKNDWDILKKVFRKVKRR
jgi:O-antigen/teichoic acid export membrane protein